MKHTLFIYFGILLLAFTSCEDVIDVELENPEPRLVVDGLVRVNTQQPVNRVAIGLRISSNFFDANPPVNDAVVALNHTTSGKVYPLALETDNNGIYTAEIATEVLTSGAMELQVTFQGEMYTATNTFEPSTPILSLEQGDNSLFDTESIEIVIGYADPADRENYYLLDFDKGEFFTSADTFYQGQYIEFSFFHDTAEPGDVLEVTILGANRGFINYMDQILELSGESGLTPFQVPVSAARGNITGPDDHNRNFALGYFAISEAYSETLVIE